MGLPELQIVVTPPGGQPAEISKFTQYDISLGVKKAAATWSMGVPANAENLAVLQPGSLIEIKNYGATQLRGIIDERSEATRPANTDLMVAGRCVMGLLMDSIVPHDSLSIANKTIEQVAQKCVARFSSYLTGLTSNLAASRYMQAGGTGSAGSGGLKWGPGANEVALADPAAVQRAIDAGNPILASQLIQPRYVRGEAVSLSSGSPAGKVGSSSPYYAGVGGEQFVSRVKLGTTWYALLTDLAKQIGCKVMSAADGHLAIVRPCYSTDPSAYGPGVVLLWDSANRRAAGGNVLGVESTRSKVGRCSEYIVAGLGKAGKANTYSTSGDAVPMITGGQIKLVPVQGATKGIGTIMDPGPPFWSWDATYTTPTARLGVLGFIEAHTTNTQRLTRLARRQMIERALAGYKLQYQLRGHFSPTGILYVPDTMINVIDQRNKISGAYYIAEVKRSLSMQSGRTTTLTLWPRDLWLTGLDESTVGWPEYYRAVAPRVDW